MSRDSASIVSIDDTTRRVPLPGTGQRAACKPTMPKRT